MIIHRIDGTLMPTHERDCLKMQCDDCTFEQYMFDIKSYGFYHKQCRITLK